MRLKKGDQVIVLSGKSKGTVGAVLDTDVKKNLVKVAKVNIQRKHMKPTQENPEGGANEKEAFIDASKVAFAVKKGKVEVPTRIRYKIEVDKNNKRKKIRIATRTGEEV